MLTEYNRQFVIGNEDKDSIQITCKFCGKPFTINRVKIRQVLNKKCVATCEYCSVACKLSGLAKAKNTIVSCTQCNVSFKKTHGEIRSKNNFCSKSCAATYNNKNKSSGTRRSKLEVWIEEQLTILYPKLKIKYNKKDDIGSELDVYIPKLRLAFELNGIFHYQPIYGKDKLFQVQKNDQCKTKACHDHKIDLCIIDVSALNYFKPSNAQRYLDIVTTIINQRA